MNSLKKNLSYQIIYQILNTCIPLITSPYLARTLGATQQGVFSYTQSIVNYFTLIAMLGVMNYGTRIIAEDGTDKEKRSIDFWNIYILQFLLSFLCLIIYIMCVIYVFNDNKLIMFLQSLNILGSLIDINWLYFGTEEFEITVKRSMKIRSLSVVLILIFVRQSSDLWIYTLIMAGGTFFTNFILWFFSWKLIDFKLLNKICIRDIKLHLKPNIVLFIPLAAMSVYHTMDKTMLGFFSSYEQSGFYYNTDKIINIPISVITGIGTVMMSRTTSILAAGFKNKANQLFNISIEIVSVVAIAMSFGISAIAKEFVPIFFGEKFDTCIGLIILLSPVLLIKALSNVVRSQFLIPMHKESIFIQSVFMGAVINFIINLFLIRTYGAIGAIFGTIFAELISCIWQFFKIHEQIKCIHILLKSSIYILFGTIMFFIIRLIANYLKIGLFGIVIEIIIGAIIYMLLCIIYWYVTKSELLNIIKNIHIKLF